MPLRAPDLIFLCIVLLLGGWHLDRSQNDNITSRAAMVAALVEEGTLHIDVYHDLTDDKALVNGHHYSEKAPLPALIMVPFWWLLTALDLAVPSGPGSLSPDLLGWSGFLTGTVPFALIMLLVWSQLRDQPTPLSPTWMASLPFLGSFLFMYSGSFHGHLLAALLVLCAWRKRNASRHAAASAFIAAAVLCEYSLFLFPLVWIMQDLARRRWGAVRSMVLGASPFVLLLLVMNAAITGSPFALPYSHVVENADDERLLGLATPELNALRGLLFSTYRGLFVHAPVAVLCAGAVLMRMFRTPWRRLLLHPVLLPSLLLVLLISSHSMWWGGWAMGPRHLSSVAVLLLAGGLPLLPRTETMGWLLLATSAAGLVLTVAAKSTLGYALPTGVDPPFTELILPAFRSGAHASGQWGVAWGMKPQDATFAFLLLLLASLLALRWLDRRGSRQGT
jgi:hypothetical protein